MKFHTKYPGFQVENRDAGVNRNLDETTSLYFFGARWYDPTIGRFITVSPLAPTGEEEYVYCSNDPINRFDMNGLNVE
ncbi:MAG: hypothetical protein JXR73_00265 [Candidatus Omnitrophica bacterium]|nr:hypothetical protein [Candidatus Omnitrophota bacterium]